jgi:hypothetical protein
MQDESIKSLVNWGGATMAFISVGSFVRAVYDYVGWRLWDFFTVEAGVREAIAREFLFNFLFLNGIAVVFIWAAVSTYAKKDKE